MCQCTPTPASGSPNYALTEDQHTALYQARHMLGMIYSLSSVREEFVELRMEELAVSVGLITDLLDSAIPGLVWRPRSKSNL